MASSLTEKVAQQIISYPYSENKNNNFVVHTYIRMYMRSLFRYVRVVETASVPLIPYTSTLITLVMVAQGTEALTHHVN